MDAKEKEASVAELEAFLDNHIGELVSIDFFTVPTATFRVLSVLIVLAHDRRRIVHFSVMEHPTAEWTGQQIVEAFCDGKSPRYLMRGRDGVYGLAFRDRVKALDIGQVVIAPHSPWQNPCVERVIGTLRRECFDRVIVLSNRTSDTLSGASWATITGRGRTWRRTRTRRRLAPFSRQSWEA